MSDFATALVGSLGGLGMGGSAPPATSSVGPSNISTNVVGLNLGQILQPLKESGFNGGGGYAIPNRLSVTERGIGINQPPTTFSEETGNTNYTPIIIASAVGLAVIAFLKRK